MKEKIGWIGLGKMGNPMAMRLLNAGYDVTVFNRTEGKDAELTAAGAKKAASPAEIMEISDIVILMVSDDDAVREIFSGKDGLLNPEGIKGKLIVNMSTVSAGISIEMAELCHQKGNEYLDAPVSGSVKQAQSGELVIMSGGHKEAFAKAKPVLDNLGKLTIHTGETGSGNTMKLAVNLLLGILSQGIAESVIFAKDHGLQMKDLLEVLQNGAMGSVYMKIKGEAILQDNFTPAFAVKHIAKDLRLAKAAGMKTPLGETALYSFEKAEEQHKEEDIIAIYKSL